MAKDEDLHHHHDHDHDHDHDHELEDGFEDDEIIILEDEEGNEHEFLIAETFDVEDGVYAVLVSAGGTSDEGFIFRVEQKEEDGEPYLDFVAIEDDEEWKKVEQVYNTLTDEEDDAE